MAVFSAIAATVGRVVMAIAKAMAKLIQIALRITKKAGELALKTGKAGANMAKKGVGKASNMMNSLTGSSSQDGPFANAVNSADKAMAGEFDPGDMGLSKLLTSFVKKMLNPAGMMRLGGLGLLMKGISSLSGGQNTSGKSGLSPVSMMQAA